MVRRKNVRTRGKISFSNYFRKFKDGDSVAVVMERSLANNLPKRIQGKTGVVKGKRGRSQSLPRKTHGGIAFPIGHKPQDARTAPPTIGSDEQSYQGKRRKENQLRKGPSDGANSFPNTRPGATAKSSGRTQGPSFSEG